MQKEKIDAIIDEELNHIPTGDYNQDIFRIIYSDVRGKFLLEHGEDDKKWRKKALCKAIEEIKKDRPGFEPEYDCNYFGLE